jgi:hypothetical protein
VDFSTNAYCVQVALAVVRPTEPLRRFARNSKDCVEVFAGLVKDLGTAQSTLLRAVPNAVLFGALVGAEADAWVQKDGIGPPKS